MNKNAKIILISNSLLLLFVFSNFSSGLGAIPSWHAGDIIDFGQSSLFKVTYFDGNSTSHQLIEANTDFKLNITAVDILSKNYRASIIDPMSVGPILQYDFDYQIITSSFENIGDIINVDYVWDYEHNTTILEDFSIDASYTFLIEPEWAIINQAIKDSLNESTIIASVNDPYQPIIYNFTLGEFLNNITSYRIMDKTDLVKAKENLTPTKRQWSLEFDLSGIIHYGTYNSTLGYNVYKPIDKYLVYYELEYDKGGVLTYYQKSFESYTEYDPTPQEFILEDKIIFGGLEAFKSNFSISTIFPALLFITFFVVKKRRQNR